MIQALKPVARLERWVVFHDCLVGYIHDSEEFPSGTRVQTQHFKNIDYQSGLASCADGTYKLGTPGTHWEHDQPTL